MTCRPFSILFKCLCSRSVSHGMRWGGGHGCEVGRDKKKEHTKNTRLVKGLNTKGRGFKKLHLI